MATVMATAATATERRNEKKRHLAVPLSVSPQNLEYRGKKLVITANFLEKGDFFPAVY